MKYLSVVTIAALALTIGCGKKEESQTTVAQKEAPIAKQETQVEKETPPAPSPDLSTQLDAAVKTVEQEVAKVTKNTDLPILGNALTVTEPEKSVEQQTSGLMDDAKTAAMAAVSSVDWANLSWNDVSSIPYNDKDKLLAWAAPQIDTLKEQLTKAALEKGKMNLASLGGTGWEGGIKSTVSALESVRTSSPETWEMATGALVTAWDALKSEAAKYLSEG